MFTDKDSKYTDGKIAKRVDYAQRPNFTPADIRRYFVRKKVSPDFIKIGSRVGAYSMIIRRSGMKKILDHIDRYKIFLPYDFEYTIPAIEAYAVIDDIVSPQFDAISDNRC